MSVVIFTHVSSRLRSFCFERMSGKNMQNFAHSIRCKRRLKT
jgi:hypothetical protein